jgi:N12 class adenine-specific DNA methylase
MPSALTITAPLSHAADLPAPTLASGVWLLEQALNLKTPTIYDVLEVDGKEQRVLNQDETLAAREKQKRIKEQFKG